ncbi:MAG: hypothetical protein M1818_001385 [Claussenomyces sp. TS43310]|nr:MAG: hypothetical protein M1818_001385 [Claussenomyces sp. TS43310]
MVKKQVCFRWLSSYVRALEARVRELESQLQSCQMILRQATVDSLGPPGDDSGSKTEPESNEKTSLSAERKESMSTAERDAPESLESGLKLLSLEATAERYLGSSSGVTFARLTQAVLKRLRPDLQPFSFRDVTSQENPAVLLTNQVEPGNPNYTSVTGKTISPREESSDDIQLPPKAHAYRLAEYYWCHSHTLYPFVRKAQFMGSLEKMYNDPEDLSLRSSSSWLYTMWMIFAIGSTTLSSVMITEETESIAFWNEAMTHFDATLEEGNIAALNGILLQVSYSFFNQVGPRYDGTAAKLLEFPDTWYLIGMAIRLALGMGLHTKASKFSVSMPKSVQEYRSRIFFSLYMMDRLVSITLGRPFGLRDEDIEIEPFAAADDCNILQDRILPHEGLTLPATAVPLHILSLRKLAGEIFQEIYSNRNVSLSQPDRDSIIRKLHEQLIDWRRGMPFPLPESQTLRVPHLSTTWFDLNYHNHVIMLYRPSPLCPVITVEKVTILADAAMMSIRHISTMHRQQKYAFNWLNLFSLFTSTLALIYSITVQPNPISSYLQESDSLTDLRLAAHLLHTFGKKFPSALKYQSMVQEVIARLESHLPLHLSISPSGQADAYDIRGLEQQQRPGTSPGTTETAYPSFFTAQIAHENIKNLASNARSSNHSAEAGDLPSLSLNPPAIMNNLPLAVQLSHTSGLFDDFAAQDLVSGFDTTGSTDLDIEFMSYLVTNSARHEGG